MFGAKGSEFGKKSNQDHNASPFYVSQSKPSGFSSSGLFQQSNPSFSSPPQGLFSVPVTAAPRFGFKADDSLPTSQPATAAPRFGFKKDDSLPTFQRFGAENSSTDNSGKWFFVCLLLLCLFIVEQLQLRSSKLVL